MPSIPHWLHCQALRMVSPHVSAWSRIWRNFVKVWLDPNRGFPLRLPSAPVYPQSTLTESEQPWLPPVDPPSYIHSTVLQNHPVDAKARKRTARHTPRDCLDCTNLFVVCQESALIIRWRNPELALSFD